MLPKNTSSKQIVVLIKSRDQKGLSLLYDHYSQALLGFLGRMLSSNEEAEEALQTTFLKVWDKIEQYDQNKSGLYTWMYAIARNVALDAQRLKSYENQQRTDSYDPLMHESSYKHNIHDSLDIKTVLRDVDEKFKSVINLLYLQGYSQSEVAEELDIPLGTVKSRLRIGMSKIRENLAQEKELFFGALLIIVIIILLLL